MGSETLPHKVGPNEDDRDLSGGEYDTPIWLIVWCVWVCDESHIGYLLGRSGLYQQLQEASIVTNPFEL